VEICAIDIQTCRPYFFGEGAGHALRCFLLYSGIHYDAVALSTNGGGNDESGDVTMFAADDETAVARAVALANELRRVRTQPCDKSVCLSVCLSVCVRHFYNI
jgi:ubiquitin thioesterase OTU1